MKFEEFQISNAKLFELLQSNPVENLIPTSKYFIYKNFLSLNNFTKAEEFKEDIILNYRDSKYAEILLDPKSTLNFGGGPSTSLVTSFVASMTRFSMRWSDEIASIISN